MTTSSKIISTVVSLPLLFGTLATPSMAQTNTTTTSDQAPTQSQSIGAQSSSKNFCVTKVAVRSNPTPGRNLRFSENFNLKGVKKLRVIISQNGKINNSISFSLKQDQRGPGLDPTLRAGVKTGSYVFRGDTRSLYVANVQGAGKAPFIVQFCR